MNDFFVIPIDIYDASILVSIGDVDNAFKNIIPILKEKKFNKKQIKEVKKVFRSYIETSYGFVIDTNSKTQILWLKEIPMDPDTFATVIHEIQHVVTNLMSIVGLSLSSETDEAYAYLYSYISKQFFEKYLNY